MRILSAFVVQVIRIAENILNYQGRGSKLMSDFYHTVPGRIRIKIPIIKHNPIKAQKVENLFKALFGIHNVSINSTTGSLKVMYDPDEIHSDDIIKVLRQKGYIDEVTDNDRREVNRKAVLATQAVGKAIMSVAVSRTLEARGLGLLAAFI
jgi:hypothetical protein